MGVSMAPNAGEDGTARTKKSLVLRSLHARKNQCRCCCQSDNTDATVVTAPSSVHTCTLDASVNSISWCRLHAGCEISSVDY